MAPSDHRQQSGNHIYIIAEIGTGHGGDLVAAERLVAAAAAAGADCAKFQTVFADEIVPPNVGDVPLPGGSIPLYERFRQLEQPADFYHELKEICTYHDLDFLSTPFGLRSARLLQKIGSQAIKIASPELNHLPLLTEVAGYHLPLILSSGVSRLEDIERALEITGTQEVTLLQCVTAYPAPAEDYNLRILPLLQKLFGVAVGVSDHSLDPVLVPTLAVTQGATVIEKHITLSHDGNGLDDPIALEPEQFAAMVQSVRQARKEPAEQTLKRLTNEYGTATVEAVLGSGRKLLAPSERDNYGRTNRSVHAVRDLNAGDPLTPEDYALLRTEKLLHPGIPPHAAELLPGAVLSRSVPAGQGIRWKDLMTLHR
ncbi:N-acetylneuraminate synthase family protein [Spirochaeta africana]|uniref:Sialic acid synthase n=1 Tax=Spirochaeta africana (strain ATCC 700263 / DSM 8902 / Z-7692) TaxID=889378 RepID=H9UK11_SPIAZ|nr:N-acetylneuraminate synthase family protein [Spirochaeta africana]AFG37854.1 sialic acid synthase [Spirochaeta africana DSM 8902]